jgi:hypothetical protein
MSEEVITHGSDEFNLLERELCPEGTCIGLIGPDGFCKECGRPGRGPGVDPRNQGLRSEHEVAGELAAAVIEGDATPAPEDFAERRLCPDGACIGVIGPDGVCGECGRRADGR